MSELDLTPVGDIGDHTLAAELTQEVFDRFRYGRPVPEGVGA